MKTIVTGASVALLLSACNDPLKEVALIHEPRVLAARVEVALEPERASPALGESASVRWLVARQALATVLAGVAIGVPAAWVTGRLAARQLSSLLYEVTATDPITIAAAIGVLVIVAMGAGSLPARRAARIDPAMALRSE